MRGRLNSLCSLAYCAVVLPTLCAACTSDLRGSLQARGSSLVEPDAGGDPVATSTVCPKNTWDDDADPGTDCTPWTACQPGQYVHTTGTDHADQVCIACPTGMYSDGPNQLECLAWTQCTSGQLEAEAGSASNDRVCANASANEDDGVAASTDSECELGTAIVEANEEGDSIVCQACDVGEYCGGGLSLAVSCNGTGWDHDEDPATPCHEYSRCVAGYQVSSAGSGLEDRGCSACPRGTFSESVNAAQCTPFRVCEPGTFISEGGTSMMDVTCAGCPAGSFSTDADVDSCEPWTNCQAGEFVSHVGSATEDRSCQPCAEGTYNNSLNAGACVADGECAPGTVLTQADTGQTAPPSCQPCDSGQYCAGAKAAAESCVAGTYDDDGDPATPCSAMTICAAGEYVSTVGSALTDRVCTACADGQFSAVQNAESCQAWSVCAAGSYAVTPGSSSADRKCEACADGSFSAVENAPSCTSWTTCSAPTQYVSNTPDASSDRECGTCVAPKVSRADNASSCTLPAFQMTDGTVSMEAEHFQLQLLNGSQHAWGAASNELASGAQCMHVGPDVAYQWGNPVGFAPQLQFRVNFTTTGTFYVNLRGAAGTAGSGSDSCFAAIDDQLSTAYDFDDQANTYGWRQQALSVSTTGTHVVSIWPSEDGFCVDKIVVSADSTLPTDTGPAESAFE